jgi:phage baseplate assembly protein W
MANEIAIALPFRLNSLGVIDTTSDQGKIWQDRVRSVLGTTLRERVMRPNVGTVIPYSLFDGVGDAASQVKNEVQHAFQQQLHLLTLTATDVTFNIDTETMDVAVTYTLPNQQKVTTNIGFISINGTNPAYEELA